MPERGAFTLSEITSQPSTWRDTLSAFRDRAGLLKQIFDERSFDQIVFTGCGSTYYLSILGASLFQALIGIPAQAQPASQLVLFPDLVYVPGRETLLIAISRSGETTETVEAVELYHQKTKNPCIAITCYPDSALGRMAEVVLAAEAAQEQSVAQTRSFTSMAVLAEAAASYLAGKDDYQQLARVIPAGERLLTDCHDLARKLGEAADIEQFFFLGSGFLYGVACEAMLKMKEMSLSHSEAFYTLEFRHGPMSMVNERTRVIGLLSEETQAHEVAVLQQMHSQGGQVMAVVEDDRALALADGSHVVRLQSGLPNWARPALYLPVLQLMAYYRAMSRGQNPDRPANLEAVVSLKRLRS